LSLCQFQTPDLFLLLEKVSGGTSVFGGVEEAAKAGFKDGVKDFNSGKDKAIVETSKDSAIAGLTGMSPVVSPLTGKGLGSGIDKVTSSAPKTFNINIENLIENFEITTNNIQEGAERTKDMILQTLLTAVNDVSIIDN